MESKKVGVAFLCRLKLEHTAVDIVWHTCMFSNDMLDEADCHKGWFTSASILPLSKFYSVKLFYSVVSNLWCLLTKLGKKN